MLRDVDRRTAVLATQGQALREPEQHEEDRRDEPDLGMRGEQPDDDRRASHDRDREQERVLASDNVTDPTEDDRAERPDEEACRVRGEGRQELRRRVVARKDERREERREGRVQVEVVPLDDRARGRGADDERKSICRSRSPRPVPVPL